MVLQGRGFTRPRDSKMAAHEQPVKKKQRIDGPNLNEDDLTSNNGLVEDPGPDISISLTTADEIDGCLQIRHSFVPSGGLNENWDNEFTEMYLFQSNLTKQCLCCVTEKTLRKPFEGHYKYDNNGVKQSLTLSEWPTAKLLQFLSNVQLLFDVYLNQNTKGVICSRIMEVCDAIVRNEHNLIDDVISLGDIDNKYISFLATRVLSSFLILAKDHIDILWLKKIVDCLFMFEHLDLLAVRKMIFSLEVIKRVVEWKDMEQHPLEDSEYVEPATRDHENQPSTSSHTDSHVSTFSSQFDSCMQMNNAPQNNLISASYATTPSSSVLQTQNISMMDYPNVTLPNDSMEASNDNQCHTVRLTDSESFDTTHIKCLTIKTLENKWPALVKNINSLLTGHMNIRNSENCVLTFLSLWESIISVKANLSVIETRPFHAHLESFVLLLNPAMSSVVYKQLLSLFNEVLCYGSTLALQDILPEETCSLAHLIVRHVKDFRILDGLPLKRAENNVSFIGYHGAPISYHTNSFTIVDNSLISNQLLHRNSELSSNIETDKTLLQKMVLLVLKSVAITVKETRCDTSDSSIDSSDFDVFQDMQLIERSIRDVLKKLESFIKSALEFHPESNFSKILVHLFSDQDDYLIESMVCTLDITVGIFYRNSAFPDLAHMLNPMNTFIEFLKIVSHDLRDYDVLLDYLVSNETCFLLYLLRFLKYVKRNWSKFVSSCQEHNSNGLDDTMSVLIRLRLQIGRLVAKSLFPYNISPVLRLLEVCESLYEGNEVS